MDTIQELVKFLNQYRKENLVIDIDLEKGVELFLSSRKTFCSEGTYSYYKNSALKPIMNFFESKKIHLLSQVTNLVIYEFIDYEQENEISNTTINKRVRAFLTMAEYLRTIEVTNVKALEIKKLTELTKEVIIPTDEEVRLFINYLDTNVQSILLKIVFNLILDSGIRRTEVTKIKTKHINFETNSIYLDDTKTKKPRYIFFSEETKALIQKIYDKNNKYLLKTEQSETISPCTISSAMERIKAAIGVINISCHKLRHYFATNLLKNNANINEVKELLGHSSTEMTSRYVHSRFEELSILANECNIRKTLNKKSDE